jgi:hypothetical protein
MAIGSHDAAISKKASDEVIINDGTSGKRLGALMRGLIAPNLNIFLSSVKYFCVVLLTYFESSPPMKTQ